MYHLLLLHAMQEVQEDAYSSQCTVVIRDNAIIARGNIWGRSSQ